MERTEELLSSLNGELHELLGDHREFKRETIGRLDALERDVRNIPAARRAAVGAVISIVSGIAALAGMLGFHFGGVL